MPIISGTLTRQAGPPRTCAVSYCYEGMQHTPHHSGGMQYAPGKTSNIYKMNLWYYSVLHTICWQYCTCEYLLRFSIKYVVHVRMLSVQTCASAFQCWQGIGINCHGMKEGKRQGFLISGYIRQGWFLEVVPVFPQLWHTWQVQHTADRIWITNVGPDCSHPYCVLKYKW